MSQATPWHSQTHILNGASTLFYFVLSQRPHKKQLGGGFHLAHHLKVWICRGGKGMAVDVSMMVEICERDTLLLHFWVEGKAELGHQPQGPPPIDLLTSVTHIPPKVLKLSKMVPSVGDIPKYNTLHDWLKTERFSRSFTGEEKKR